MRATIQRKGGKLSRRGPRASGAAVAGMVYNVSVWLVLGGASDVLTLHFVFGIFVLAPAPARALHASRISQSSFFSHQKSWRRRPRYSHASEKGVTPACRRSSTPRRPIDGNIYMSALPSIGADVSVLLEGRWLNGNVVEASDASGEFLVEFDDEDEVQAWVSIGQPWRRLRPDIEATPVAESARSIATPPPPPPPHSAPVLSAPSPPAVQPAPAPPPPTSVPPQPVVSVPLPPPPPPLPKASPALPSHSPPPMPASVDEFAANEDDTMWTALREEFAMLHEATVATDGYGAEPLHDTHARFSRLAAAASQPGA
jgi:hypothetical protein